jgi:hypothetical protein
MSRADERLGPRHLLIGTVAFGEPLRGGAALVLGTIALELRGA